MWRDPLAFVSFDQRVDAAAALPHISFRAGSDVIAARLATPEEIEKDATVKELVAQEEAAEHPGRYLAFKPVSLLPGDSRVEVRVAGDTPSAEGPARPAASSCRTRSTRTSSTRTRSRSSRRCRASRWCRPGCGSRSPGASAAAPPTR